MNAPTALSHLVPDVQQREVPAALLQALKARFGDRCSTALAIREQHGRDESSFQVPPPAAVVFARWDVFQLFVTDAKLTTGEKAQLRRAGARSRIISST